MASLPLLKESLGQVIRTLRFRAGYSQERFAAVIKRHRTYMGLLERGKANPTLKTLHMVAEGLRVNVPQLFALTEAAETEALRQPSTSTAKESSRTRRRR